MDWSLFFTFLASCMAAAATGAMFQPGPWYEGLAKPDWFPPRWVFPVAWTTLYILMSLAAMRVAPLPGAAQGMGFWALQIALNTLWSPIFFGLHKMRAAMIVMVFLWASVAATMLCFFGVDFVAGLLFVPYLAWVTIAAALNITSIRLNPKADGVGGLV
jgi:tryptophan-rich sensory protein